jgi:hypothetical protein
MVIGEGKDCLLGLLTDQTSKIFKALGAVFERLGAGVIDALAECCLIKSHKPIIERSDWTPRVSKAPWAH